MKVVVTGGAGFIGANLTKALLERGASVTIIDDLSTGYMRNIAQLDVQLVRGSILEDNLLETLRDADCVVHLAAVPSVPRSITDPLKSHEANATGTLRVLRAAMQHGAHVIVASSSSVYGASEVIPKVESANPMPVSPYAVSKLATEAYAISFQRCYDLPTLAFRFFNVFGPLQAPGHAYAAVVPAFTHAALTGSPVQVHGDGTQSRDFTYVGTVVATMIEAIERRVTSLTPVNLAFGTRHTLLELLDLIERELGGPIRREHIEPRLGDVRHSQADPALLQSLFPAISPTPLSEGLRETIDWMRHYVKQSLQDPAGSSTLSSS
jgi:UDP-glucose 4-epimerase